MNGLSDLENCGMPHVTRLWKADREWGRGVVERSTGQVTKDPE